jgi:hypothetical protein
VPELAARRDRFNLQPIVIPTQERWKVCGIGLPRELLREVHAANAERVLAGTGSAQRR